MTSVGIYGDNNPSGVSRLLTPGWAALSIKFSFHSIRAAGRISKDPFPSKDRFGGNSGHSIMWSVPLIVYGATLEQAAAGACDNYWLDAAKALASTPGTAPIIVRTGWEFNIAGGQPWADFGHEAAYVASFQHFVDIFNSVSNRFEYDWNFNIGQNDPSASYPGDKYVNIISIDDYYNQTWDSTDPVQAFNYNVTRPYGLQWLQDFATAHGKPTAFSEWGAQNDNAGPYIDLMSKRCGP